nr:MAG TPA: hypothetical protein [Crassvirales sp.]
MKYKNGNPLKIIESVKALYYFFLIYYQINVQNSN